MKICCWTYLAYAIQYPQQSNILAWKTGKKFIDYVWETKEGFGYETLLLPSDEELAAEN